MNEICFFFHEIFRFKQKCMCKIKCPSPYVPKALNLDIIYHSRRILLTVSNHVYTIKLCFVNVQKMQILGCTSHTYTTHKYFCLRSCYGIFYGFEFFMNAFCKIDGLSCIHIYSTYVPVCLLFSRVGWCRYIYLRYIQSKYEFS